MDRVVVGRPVNGIPLNGGREFLLDDTGAVRVFDSPEQAIAFLIAAGMEPEELRHMTIITNGGKQDDLS